MNASTGTLLLAMLVSVPAGGCLQAPEFVSSDGAADVASLSDAGDSGDEAVEVGAPPDIGAELVDSLDSGDPGVSDTLIVDVATDLIVDTASDPADGGDGPETATPVTWVVGDGSPVSCSEAAFDEAIASQASVITFDCGGPKILPITSEKVVDRTLLIDGGGLVTLDAGGAGRILRLDAEFQDTQTVLEVANLSFINADTSGMPEDQVLSGGAAIHRSGGALVVTDCVFTNNRCPDSGAAVAGGAVYAIGKGSTTITGTVFTANDCSNGGALGVMESELTVSGSTFTGNRATGAGGNLNDGGAGGAIFIDGANQSATISGCELSNNVAGALGGGVFRIAQSGVGEVLIERTLIADNSVPTPVDAGDYSQAGGAYFQGLQVTIIATTISGNSAGSVGGIVVHAHPGLTSIDMTNVTIANNVAEGGQGAGINVGSNVAGTFTNVTVAGNSTAGEASFAPGFGGGANVVLRNSIIANNTKAFIYENTSCQVGHSGDFNVQWPATNEHGSSELACTADSVFVDPELSALGDNGGPTPTMLPSSSALGVGTDCPAIDQRGQPRPAEGCTVGAVEP